MMTAILNRTIAPASQALDHFEVAQAKTRLLDNGIPFHSIISGTQPVIRLEIIFNAGNWYEEKPGVAFLSSKMLSGGSRNFPAKEIEESIALFGAFMELNPGPDRSSLTIYALSRHLQSLLPLILNIISEPVFPDKELDNLKNITIQNLKVNLNKTSYLANVRFKELLFGEGHPYGSSLQEKRILNSTKEDLSGFHKEYFNYNNCDIILAGNGTEDFFKLINNVFGKAKWNSSDRKSAKALSSFTPGAKKEKVIKEGTLQSSIRMGTGLFTISHPDYFKTFILIEILGGYFGSRLMKNIREDKGYTYGINASLICLKHEGYLTIGTDVKKEFTEDTLKEIKKEIEILRTIAVSNEELETVKNYLLGTFLSSLNTPFSLADKFKTIYFNELGYSFYDNYIKSIKEITPGDLQATANKYLIPDNFIEVIAGS
ncbi:MAG TPA: pitrilysin family protein [Cytophagaceae bacterium]|jgi:zinc protease|nr:pitrilysin family protein [Cytophagaceae bacterium]